MWFFVLTAIFLFKINFQNVTAVFTLVMHFFLPRDHITRLYLSTVAGVKCFYGGRKSRPVLHPLCSYIYILFRYNLMYLGVFDSLSQY